MDKLDILKLEITCESCANQLSEVTRKITPRNTLRVLRLFPLRNSWRQSGHHFLSAGKKPRRLR